MGEGKPKSPRQQNVQREFQPPPATPSAGKRSRWGFRGKTVWDWLPILGTLAIPIMIAVGTWGITWQQGNLEDQRAQAGRELAEQRAQDEALQAYLDQMSTLLLEKDLRSSEEASEAQTLARARTVAVIQRLDSDRNGDVIRFLHEAGLIGIQRDLMQTGQSSIRLLAGADLGGHTCRVPP